MKKITNKIAITVMLAGLLSGCTKFLDQTPNAVLSSDQVKEPERLLTATYATQGNDHYDVPFSL